MDGIYRGGINWDGVAYIEASIVDENNVPCLNADNQITFTVSGAGVLAVTDNGDLSSTESFLSNKKFSYKGRCIVVVKANANSGKITITASTDKLISAQITVDAISQ